MTSPSVEVAADAVRAAAGREIPKVAVVLGSGLGEFADGLERSIAIAYADIPGFPRSTVTGHAGRLVLGEIAGAQVACMQGRQHLYEGHAAADLAFPVRVLKRLGVEILVLTNAAGGLRPDMVPGTIMVMTDHINLTARNPLIGPNDDAFGPRFFDMSQAYDPQLNPIRARVQLGLRVLSYNDLETANPGYHLFLAYQVTKEVMASLGSGAAATTGTSVTGPLSLGV